MNNRWFNTFILLASLALLTFSGRGLAQFEEDFDYTRITPPLATSDGDKVKVQEFFWYGCPHCYQFEPHIRRWMKTKADYVEFELVPAVFNNPRWKLHAQAYYTAEALGVLDKMHDQLFGAIHSFKRKLASESEIRELFTDNGVAGEAFDKTFGSFAVRVKVMRAADLSRRSGISGVPSMAVAGKFRIESSVVASYEKMIRIVNHLAARERP